MQARINTYANTAAAITLAACLMIVFVACCVCTDINFSCSKVSLQRNECALPLWQAGQSEPAAPALPAVHAYDKQNRGWPGRASEYYPLCWESSTGSRS